jgi:NitT/TauT family transport system permease protein
MQRQGFSQRFPRRYFSVPDIAIMLLIATIIYGVVAMGKEWRSEFHPVTKIDLSIWALPYYTLFSAVRGVVAYFISLSFTLLVGYLAAKSRPAEKIILPLLDILQSIPVLGFLPGLLIGLVALFPNTNTGLELAAILMIFTGQVWNMTFSYYTSLKSIPPDMIEASTVMGLDWRQRLFRLELPFSAVNLAWNSLLSMAGGWFFLIPCEAITLGDREYRLPGIGAYMDVAIKEGNSQAIFMAVIAMVLLIVLMDFVIWRPILAWVQRFRLEQVAGGVSTEPLMQIWIRESRIVRWVKLHYRDYIMEKRKNSKRKGRSWQLTLREKVHTQSPALHDWMYHSYHKTRTHFRSLQFYRLTVLFCLLMGFALMTYGAFKLVLVLMQVPPATWFFLMRDALWTLLRVLFALILSTLWAVPIGIWIGTSSRRVRVAQPIIQVLASFPAPMLYPLAIGLFFAAGINFNIGSMLLMLLGVQWYVLFNVLAGALRIPQELNYALSLMEASRWDRWKTLYLPSIFPSLVTGWMTAAGGAWNASVVAEYFFYRGTILKTEGLGASLSVATANENFPLFAASITLMVAMVILLNRTVWARIYRLAQTRFRMDT